MNEKKTIKTLIIVSLILALFGGLVFWFQGWSLKGDFLAGIFPKNHQVPYEISLLKLIPGLAGFEGERTYLLLFQNNLELRPSGGYIGTFGILKVKNGQTIAFDIHDTNIFDGFGRVQTNPPKPLEKYLGIKNWQMRDANWSPDFTISAEQVNYFYRLQGGQEEFDGIIGLNAATLPEVLKLTGPIHLKEFDKTFQSEDVLYDVEYEVEKKYLERGIEPGERKMVFKALVKEVFNQLIKKKFWEHKELKDLIVRELNKKNILLYFKNQDIQEIFSELNWSGQINQSYEHDYLMLNEANLGARKSNFFVKRDVEYSVDLSQEEPIAHLKIKYRHQGEKKDWFSNDYRAYLRVYLPEGAWLLEAKGHQAQIDFSDELGKQVFEAWIIVLTGQEKTIEFKYVLPKNLKHDYKILVQKQPGMWDLPFRMILKDAQGNQYLKEKIIEKDWQAEF